MISNWARFDSAKLPECLARFTCHRVTLITTAGEYRSVNVRYSLGPPRSDEASIGVPIKPLFEDDDSEFSLIGNQGPTFYVRMDRAAPNRKIIAVGLGASGIG
jgi:hypothetical protein